MSYTAVPAVEDGGEPSSAGGFTIENVIFRDITSANSRSAIAVFGSASRWQCCPCHLVQLDRSFELVCSRYEGRFQCTHSSPCKSIQLEDVRFDSSEWKCEGGTGCDCFAGTSGTAHNVSPSIDKCLRQ